MTLSNAAATQIRLIVWCEACRHQVGARPHRTSAANNTHRGLLSAQGISGIKSVSMNLLDAADRAVRVTFPDVPGEEYARMWEDREVDERLARTLSSANVMLLLHGNRIRAPAWVTERAALATAIDDPIPDAESEIWHPKHAPTQVQLVDLLQHLGRPPLDAGPRRLVVMISAWDKAEGE
jgi:hypothetical protein